MASMEVKGFESPDEIRQFEGNGQVEVVNIGGQVVGRGTFEPGWKWSKNVKPIAQTDSCQVSHIGYVVSGRMRVFMDDGSENEVGPGQVMAIRPAMTLKSSATSPASRSTSARSASTQSARRQIADAPRRGSAEHARVGYAIRAIGERLVALPVHDESGGPPTSTEVSRVR